MATDATVAKLRHLDQASELLSIASPAVSSYLQITRSSLDRHLESIETPTSSRLSCNACGNIMIPGWSSSYIRAKTPGKPKRKRTPRIQRENNDNETVKTVELRCHSCNEINQSRTAKPALSRKRNREHRSETGNASRMLETRTETPRVHREDQSKPISNDGTGITKKRARGKKAGLEAMLAKGKATQSATKSNGFDIMDFMKG